jgi:cell division cycle protein 20 (cofactor of APC complex)
VAVALGNKIYQWNATSGTVDELQNFDQIEAHPTLTKWSKEGQFCAVGFSDGQLKV